MRFEDSPDLFGCGVGRATLGTIECDCCGMVYNKEADDEHEDYSLSEDIRHTEFAGMTICECCFERVEAAVYRRRIDLLKWLNKINESRSKKITEERALLERIS